MKQEEKTKNEALAQKEPSAEENAPETTGGAAAEAAEEPVATDGASDERNERNESGEQDEKEGGAASGLLSPAAMRAFGAFLAALTEEDRQTLQALLARLQGLSQSLAAERARVARESALAALEQDGRLAGIRDRLPEIDALIARLPWLQALPIEERLAIACYLDRGMQQHAPTAEEKLEAVLSDPALLRALSERQAALRLAHGSMTPPVAARGLAPALVKTPPETLSEAKREAKRFLRVK
jgi:hypothetical protein